MSLFSPLPTLHPICPPTQICWPGHKTDVPKVHQKTFIVFRFYSSELCQFGVIRGVWERLISPVFDILFCSFSNISDTCCIQQFTTCNVQVLHLPFSLPMLKKSWFRGVFEKIRCFFLFLTLFESKTTSDSSSVCNVSWFTCSNSRRMLRGTFRIF